MYNLKLDSGVSPVIGVILMVAVTVALVALVTVVVFDIGGDVSESPDATVEIDESNGNATATLLRNENVQELYIQSDNGDTWGNSDNQASLLSGYESPMTSAGDTIDTSGFSDQSSDSSGDDTVDTRTTGDLTGTTINVIAVMPDGSEEVLTSTTIGE